MVKKAVKKKAEAPRAQGQRVLYLAEVGKGGKAGKIKAYILAGAQVVPVKVKAKKKRRRS